VSDPIQVLPAINALLNAIAAVLLVLGYVQINRRHERAHKISMLAAFVVSIVFLACYLAHHFSLSRDYDSPGVPFIGPPAVRATYLALLGSHVLLAAAVPFLAGVTIYLGLRDQRQRHRQVARWTFPIWLYVSITGVIIYVMLYHLYPEGVKQLIIQRGAATAASAEP
jgi:uncharacterized membrane protein YozB (DUF420 family)